VSVRAPDRPHFNEGDTVMLCRHIFDAARAGQLSIQWDKVFVEVYPEPRKFYRDDGTPGEAKFYVWCAQCSKLKPTERDFIEEFWQGGQLHVADFCKRRSL